MASNNWYAVQHDRDDDWGTGSYNLNEATEMLRNMISRGYEDALIAEIEEGADPICVNEYHLDDLEG